MRFLFETYKNHHNEGIEAHKKGDYPKARMHYLMAAKYLCSLAEETDAEFKQERLKKAQRLIDIAKELEGKRAAKPATDKHGLKPQLKTVDEEVETKADKWIVTNPPKTSFNDVAGLDDVKKVIQLRVIYPLQHPEVTQKE